MSSRSGKPRVSILILHAMLLLAGGVPPRAVSPLVVFPPAVFGGCCPPVPLGAVTPRFLCRA